MFMEFTLERNERGERGIIKVSEKIKSLIYQHYLAVVITFCGVGCMINILQIADEIYKLTYSLVINLLYIACTIIIL